MTTLERNAIDRLRDEVHAYHLEVAGLIPRVGHCEELVSGLVAEVRGVDGDRESHPGLAGEMAEIRRDRKLARYFVHAAWTMVTIAIGAICTAVAKNWTF